MGSHPQPPFPPGPAPGPESMIRTERRRPNVPQPSTENASSGSWTTKEDQGDDGSRYTQHLKIGHPKRKLIFQPKFFRCYVGFREGNQIFKRKKHIHGSYIWERNLLLHKGIFRWTTCFRMGIIFPLLIWDWVGKFVNPLVWSYLEINENTRIFGKRSSWWFQPLWKIFQ